MRLWTFKQPHEFSIPDISSKIWRFVVDSRHELITRLIHHEFKISIGQKTHKIVVEMMVDERLDGLCSVELIVNIIIINIMQKVFPTNVHAQVWSIGASCRVCRQFGAIWKEGFVGTITGGANCIGDCVTLEIKLR